LGKNALSVLVGQKIGDFMSTLLGYSRSLLPHRMLWRTAVLITLWLLAMISLPIMKWVWGTDVRPFALTLGVTLQAAAVFAVLADSWGWRRTLKTFLLVGALSLGVEIVGSATGFPFGGYSYTDQLWPQVGHVPLLIPLAWFMMLPAAWAVAARWRRHWAFIPLSALALTAWDLMLDPQMVAWNLWQWENPVGLLRYSLEQLFRLALHRRPPHLGCPSASPANPPAAPDLHPDLVSGDLWFDFLLGPGWSGACWRRGDGLLCLAGLAG
jgi:hypothetical protein